MLKDHRVLRKEERSIPSLYLHTKLPHTWHTNGVKSWFIFKNLHVTFYFDTKCLVRLILTFWNTLTFLTGHSELHLPRTRSLGAIFHRCRFIFCYPCGSPSELRTLPTRGLYSAGGYLWWQNVLYPIWNCRRHCSWRIYSDNTQRWIVLWWLV